jgi:uncharacterized membrane protein YuzA (DUF378 family)
MALRGVLPNSIFMLMTAITALGAVDDSIIGLFNVDLIIYLVGQAKELLKPLYLLVGFCGACLLIINTTYLLLKAKAKMIVSKISK